MPSRIISVEFDGDEPASGTLLAALAQSIPGATLVRILPPTDILAQEIPPVTASVLSPYLSAPVAKYDHPWDGRLARARVLDFCKQKIQATPTTKDIDKDCARRAFLLLRDGEPDYTREAWDLPYADVIDGRITIIPRGVKALASGHGIIAISGINDSDRKQLERHTCSLYDRVRRVYPEMPDCPFEGKSPRDTTDSRRDQPAAKTASAEEVEEEATLDESDIPGSITAAGEPTKAVGRYSIPMYPPFEWFAPPTVAASMPTPLTITREGKVFGHGALWDSCHAGYADACVPVPRSTQDYRFFHRGAVRTEDDTLVAVGHLTVGAGHAGPDLNLKAAAEHYDDASTTVAVVSAYEDRWGIYLTGSLVPDTTEEKIAALLRSPLSGDWRAAEGNLEMVAMHAVNVPGFPVDRPRVSMAASGDSLIIENCTQCASEMDMLSTEIDNALNELIGE